MDRNEFRMQMEEEEQKERQWQEIVDYYGGQKDAKSQDNIVEMLREVQELYGYIPSEKTGAMADTLGVKQTLLLQLVKLYPSFKKAPYGHCITVCTGARCGSEGSAEVFEAVLKAVETRESGAFKIMMKECLKQCKTAPNLMVDSDSYGHVKPEEVAAILSKY
ncbi:NAD(P)H-dependent oxidoreductase subunit E [Hungatella sp.]|uniref:NADH-quinone oxidoreductase subunit NuoE family protein n=1 Tax=Hungatella sp. TaxID=2613924 RepID=UPI002A8211D6|nr:NAD(P)H-dependent oxidoreductase subunit E [Hungatella sp.]